MKKRFLRLSVSLLCVMFWGLQSSAQNSKTEKEQAKSYFDLVFEYDIDDVTSIPAPNNTYCTPWGIYFDGNNYYLSCTNTQEYYKYDLSGNYLGSIDPQSGTGGLKDFCFDGEYALGSWADPGVTKLDLANQTYISVTDFPVAVSAMAYDTDIEIYYIYGERNSGYGKPIFAVDQNLNVLYSFDVPTSRSYSGIAYDPQGPWLWGYCKDSDNGTTLVQMALPSGEETGVTYDISQELTNWSNNNNIYAGGLEIMYDETEDKYIMYGLLRQACYWGIDITVENQYATDVEVVSIASPLSGFSLTAEENVTMRIKNNGTSAVSNIPVSCTFGGTTVLSGTVTGSIEPGSWLDYTFAEKVDLSSYQSYSFELSANLTGDENTQNNTINVNVENVEPYYYEPTSYCSYGDGVLSFELDDIVNMNTGCQGNGYSDYTNMHTNLLLGESYDVTVATDGPSQVANLWIDFNDDKFFSNDELIASNKPIENYGSTTFSIQIADNAPQGYFRMRIYVYWAFSPEDPSTANAQVDVGYGEAEDYMVTISEVAVSNDVAVSSISVPSTSLPGSIIPSAEVINYGSQSQTFEVTATNGSYTSTQTVTNLSPDEQVTVEFDPWDATVGKYDMQICSELEGDQMIDNNCKNQEIAVRSKERSHVIVEMGTATWCGFCPSAAIGAEELVENGHRVGIIEYHGNDAYMNEASNARLNYYGMTSFPTATFDGLRVYEGGGGTSLYQEYLPIYNQQLQTPTSYFVDLQLNSVTSTNCSVSITATKLEEISDDNLVLHLALCESNIEESWMGLEELHFVERIMIPDYNGTPLNLDDNQSETLEFDFAINYPIENCELIAFIQNTETKEILQGTKSSLTDIFDLEFIVKDETGATLENASIELENHMTLFTDSEGKAKYSNLNIGEYDYAVSLDGYQVESGSVNIIDVDVVKEITLKEEGISWVESEKIEIYPNPANDILNIETSLKISEIEICDLFGKPILFEVHTGEGNMKIDLSEFASGLYFVKTTTENGVFTKRIMKR